ncbi:hypothetical protein QE258_02060 [Arsenophonus nasoniae]|nr:hypothetical protein [Arsenophonus nasoniae]WGM06180.1 hypothetical protein QE258_02060 [Arsenophonus nasoniae]
MILSGCITKPPAISNASYQENLLKKCASVLPPLTGKTGRDLSITLTDLAMMYGQCAARHNQLSDEINQRRDLSHEQKNNYVNYQ